MTEPDITSQVSDVEENIQEVARNLRLLCLLPSIPLGGMERAASLVVKNLMMRGADAHFVVEQRWGIKVQQHIESIGGQWTGVPFVAKLGLPQTFLEWCWAIRSFARSPADLERVFNAYQPHQLLATNLNNAYFARHLARKENVRSIFRLPNPPGISLSLTKRLIDTAIWRSVYRSFDVLVCNSDFTASRLADLVDNDERIKVIRNFLPTISRSGSIKSPQLNEGRKIIIFIGQISQHKGVDVLIDAVEELIAERDDVDLILAGQDVWQDSFGTDIRQRVSNAGHAQRIRFLGHVDDVHGLLVQADIHVCPSVGEGESFPNVVLDAKQAGLPSVVFPTAGLTEAVNDNVNGIVTESCTKQALLSALQQLLNDRVLRERLGKGALASLSDYQDEKITADWVHVFTE